MIRHPIQIVLIFIAIGISSPIDTTINYLYSTPNFNNNLSDSIHTDLEKRILNKKYNLKKDFYFLFRLRNEIHMPLWEKVQQLYSNNPILTLNFLNASLQVKYQLKLSKYEHFLKSKYSIIRESAANLFGERGDSSHVKTLEEMLKNEKNFYVIKTIENSIKKLQGNHKAIYIPYLPILSSDSNFLSLFYNKTSSSNVSMTFQNEFADSIEIRPSKHFIEPHQQYKYNIKNSPAKIRYGRGYGKIKHVGIDSGWLLEGLPIHSIADGIVREIQHDLSWGVLIAIESKRNDGTPILIFYGHLGNQIEVESGQSVTAGQVIGKIGNSVSYGNGGYWAHTHIGVELSDYNNAHMHGYDDDVDRYISVDQLIIDENPNL